MQWQLRTRTPSEAVSGANVRIQYGDVFGGANSPSAEFAEVDPRSFTSLYAYHPGDIFLPGSESWVFEPQFELPLITLWGNAFSRRPNTFNPIQPPQVWSQPNVQTNGIGGLQAGDLDLEGLLNPEGESAPFQGDFAVPLNY